MGRYVLASGVRAGDRIAFTDHPRPNERNGRRIVTVATRDAELNVKGWPPNKVRVWWVAQYAHGICHETWNQIDVTSHVELLDTAEEIELRAELDTVTRERDEALAKAD